MSIEEMRNKWCK